MMISVELLLNVALIIALIVLVSTWVWQAKNDSYYCRVTRFFTLVVLTSIEIGLLTVHLLNGSNWDGNLMVAYLWLVNVVMAAFSLHNR